MKTLVVGGMVLLLCAFGWSDDGIGQQVPGPQGELRIVDKHPRAWAWIVWNIFERLIEYDKDGTLVPRLATSWQWLDERTLEMSLRQGVTFQNGEVFDAEIVKLNWEEHFRLRQPFREGTFMNFKPGSRLEILDPYTIRLVFPEPDGGTLGRLTLLHIVPYVNGVLNLAETSVTEQHWSVGQVSVQAQTSPSPSHPDPDCTEELALGQQVYVSFCASCHGVNLEGQPNWQKRLPMGNLPAPPHDESGHTWHHTDQWLFEIVKYGGRYHAPTGYRSAMPAYQEMLSDIEIWAVLAFIKSRWPASIRVQQEQLTAGHRAERP